ncbi:MAG: TetR/AcrR family transcriptional regulator [Desulfobacterales bacterium]|nr:TetR/AcrR family transcriptional regulator [Desulfobacterales bacterium]MCP4162070.1 TetR/AcrR family transcriptional regulator [Deltaproteobacteria bacterium]
MESTFLKLKENERELRKNVLIEAAMVLFSKKPFHEIGMRDIASEAGVSPASIYRYFASKDDLYVEALKIDISAIVKRLEKRKKKSTIEELAIKVVDYMFDQEATFQLMCHFLIRGDDKSEAMDKFSAIQVFFVDEFNKMIKSITGDKNPVFHSQAFFASLTGVVMMFRNYPNLSKKERRELMHKIALVIIQKGKPVI